MRRVALGNPLQSEVSAFRWLVVVIVGAVSVILVAKIISAQAAIVWGTFLMFLVGFQIIKGVLYLIGAPDEEEDDEEEDLP